MPSEKFLVTDLAGLEPLTVTISQVERLTGESRSQIYNRIGRGEYDAVKSGQRTLIIYESIKRRISNLQPAKIKAPCAASASARGSEGGESEIGRARTRR